MKKLTICIILGLATYSLFISINYNKLKLENKRLDSQNFNLRNILDEEKYNEEKGYYKSERGIYLINEDRFVKRFDLRENFNLEKTDFEMQIINNPIDKYDRTLPDANTTGEIIEEIGKIRNLWYKEIEYNLNQSKEYLSEEEYDNLIKGQKIWEDYMTSERVSYPLPDDLSGYPRILKIDEERRRVRQRAIDLMAYLYALKMYAGEDDMKVDFYYNKEKN